MSVEVQGVHACRGCGAVRDVRALPLGLCVRATRLGIVCRHTVCSVPWCVERGRVELCPEIEAPVARIDGIPEEPSPQDAEGCGCASGGPAGVAVFGLVALAARRSRRDERSAD